MRRKTRRQRNKQDERMREVKKGGREGKAKKHGQDERNEGGGIEVR